MVYKDIIFKVECETALIKNSVVQKGMDIYNYNVVPNQDIYTKFNNFIFSDDIKILGKLLYRFKFFEQIKDLPGDIVELGVFKGSGIATFSKFVSVFCPNSNKKIIGFDIFNTSEASDVLSTYEDQDKQSMETVYKRVDLEDLTFDKVNDNLKNCSKFTLVKGDVVKTIPEYLKNNPGFRISLLYMDMDIETPTYESLKNLWDRILPGGVVVFDEYEYHAFSESNGVDKFLKEFGIKYNVKSTNITSPSAFLIKE